MAKRFIDAEDFYKRQAKRCNYNSPIIGTCTMDNITLREALKEQPTADAVEVVRCNDCKYGKWIYHECVSSYDGAISGYSCSNCSAFVNEEMFDSDEFHRDYCGNCGAKMDGKDGT